MDEPQDTAVSTVLLGYSTLSKTQRDVFMDQLNDFMFQSPQQQKRTAEGWLRSCEGSTYPSARAVAESAAKYAVERAKGPKKKSGS
ncbi:hypothetical protein [Dyella mobilis]|uniref:Uncharacterized protein n=1 Tax=Dyella mobilis TaxID=1849582 RepID=A0ABS2KJ65_9GAMM|nr:hypothetical protein [Dyella mobilis]MBM7131196.1 hypothetical protein [Dyella mobilis]GLQ98869.1 hypothetical protein GCM10007863_32890 [Dyella mobilis]